MQLRQSHLMLPPLPQRAKRHQWHITKSREHIYSHISPYGLGERAFRQQVIVSFFLVSAERTFGIANNMFFSLVRCHTPATHNKLCKNLSSKKPHWPFRSKKHPRYGPTPRIMCRSCHEYAVSCPSPTHKIMCIRIKHDTVCDFQSSHNSCEGLGWRIWLDTWPICYQRWGFGSTHLAHLSGVRTSVMDGDSPGRVCNWHWKDNDASPLTLGKCTNTSGRTPKRIPDASYSYRSHVATILTSCIFVLLLPQIMTLLFLFIAIWMEGSS